MEHLSLISTTKAVVETNDDACQSKYSCVKKGYYQDPFVKFFVKDTGSRSPLINRGYYSRVAAFRLVMESFLMHGTKRKQIVSLGAGFDTSFFYLKEKLSKSSDQGLEKEGNFIFYEVDYAEVVQKKKSIILRHNQMTDIIFGNLPQEELQKDPSELHSETYHLISVDLSDITTLKEGLLRSGIDTQLPTLFLSECVLIYLKSENSDLIVQWASENFPQGSFCTYEQINPNDGFGKMMVQNIEKRGCALLGINKYPTLEAQSRRYKEVGWDHVKVMDMFTIYNQLLNKKDKERIEHLEIFDEFEEWRLIQQHYCIVFAQKGEQFELRQD